MQLLCKNEYCFYAPFLYTEVISIEKGCFYMRKSRAAAIVLLILCTLAACSLDQAEVPHHSDENMYQSVDVSLQESLNLGESFEPHWSLKSGKLIHTFTDARFVTSIDGIPDTGCFLPDALMYLNEENQWEPGNLPSFVQADGSFAGASVILIDVTTTSENATQYTTKDLDSEGYPMGAYDDPYLFRVDTIGTIVALNYPGNDALNYWPLASMDYNSLYHHNPELPDNHYSYRLEPGETIEFTIGFIIYEDRFRDCEVDFSQLYFNILHQVAPGKLIDLGLEVA